MAEIEMRGDDVNTFAALAQPVATLSVATGGDLLRIRRHEELRGPNGFGDELRAALICESVTWGALTLLRAPDRADDADADAALLASVSGHRADGLRRALLLDAAAPAVDRELSVGVVLIALTQPSWRSTSSRTGGSRNWARLAGSDRCRPW